MSFYPNFRAKFIRANAWGSDAPAPGSSELVVKMSTPQGGASGFCKPLVLPQLDLNTVGGKDEPPVSESIMKRNKLALFEKQCSQVCEGLYVSGEYVAKSRETLRAHGITHVVNCVGAMYPEYFRSDGIQYRTLWLQGEAGGGPAPAILGGDWCMGTHSKRACDRPPRSARRPGARPLHPPRSGAEHHLRPSARLAPRAETQTAPRRTSCASCTTRLTL